MKYNCAPAIDEGGPASEPLKETILVVDDDAVALLALSRLLRKNNYEVVCATNGQEALDRVRERRFGMVLLDQKMPDIDGLEVLRSLRTDSSPTDLPVIMVTADERSTTVVDALNLGANDYLTKPVDFPVALARIRLHLRISRSEAALRESEQNQARMAHQAEMLLREIHHRVKNNLAFLASMLNLRVRTLANEETKQLFQEMQARIYCLALIHQKLYQSSDLEMVDAADYLKELAERAFEACSADSGRIRLVTNLAKAPLPIEQAIPCGLIVVELVTNSFKYAFPGNRDGQVSIELQKTGTEFCLEIMDDGVGMDSTGKRKDQSFGLRLVGLLVKQLRASMQQNGHAGTSFKINFPVLASQTRGQ